MIDKNTGRQKIGVNGRKVWKRETVQKNDWNDRNKAAAITEFILARAGDFIDRFTELIGTAEDIRETGNTPVYSRRTAERNREIGNREQRAESRKRKSRNTERNIAETDRAIKELEIIKQPVISEMVWLIIRMWIPLLVLAAVITVIVLLVKRYSETIREKGINRWNLSLSVVMLVIIVFFGDYAKKLTDFNLIVMWLITDVVLIGIAWYKYGCDENRGWR